MLFALDDDTVERPMGQSVTSEDASTQAETSTPYIFTDWLPWYQGIDRAVGTSDLAFDTALPVARKQNVNVLRIDLQNSGVSFCTTPAGGMYQTIGDTVTGFLSANPTVMVAINANFSWYDTDAVGGNFALMGLAVSQGNVVCDPRIPAPQPTPKQTADVPNDTYAGAMAMLISQENGVTFQRVTQADPNWPSDTYTAIAGSPNPGEGWPPQPYVPGQPLLLVDNGVNQATPEACPTERIAGRTAVGASADGQYLYLVTLDGCENAAWPNGGAFYDIAQWLIIAGASTGLNLDGGGSTAMACRDSNNNPILMNVPYGAESLPGVQRAVGNFFGVITQPLS
ncbi:phosphodiester glycosidase family protein [Streptomyces lydicus]|uniref:phosphodiester glycosidase family protein n=1 Tax=Streptomyces lydicus TaxID=47763 RepID=UPI00286FE2B9|nr:phosphodiester glycosidase family protein [Streptomyces lydicus]